MTECRLWGGVPTTDSSCLVLGSGIKPVTQEELCFVLALCLRGTPSTADLACGDTGNPEQRPGWRWRKPAQCSKLIAHTGDPESLPGQHSHDSSQLSVNPFPQEPTLAPGLYGPKAHNLFTHTYPGKYSHIQNKKINFKNQIQ